jgi:hypothetical protein
VGGLSGSGIGGALAWPRVRKRRLVSLRCHKTKALRTVNIEHWFVIIDHFQCVIPKMENVG